MSTKNVKAAEARAKAQAQVRAKERRTTMIIVAVSLVAVALFGALVYFIIDQGRTPELGAADSVAPAASEDNGGIPVGSDGVVGGEMPSDVTRMDIYFDFMCPVCGQFEDINAADIDEMREAGEVAVFYHPISILDRFSNGTQYSTRSAAAAGVVADQAPEAFVDFVQAMFANQPEEGSDGLSDEQISQIAIGAGVPEDVAGSLADADFRKWATAATDRSRTDGVTGTPTVRVSETGAFEDGVALNSSSDAPQVNYFQDGVLRQYVESLG